MRVQSPVRVMFVCNYFSQLGCLVRPPNCKHGTIVIWFFGTHIRNVERKCKNLEQLAVSWTLLKRFVLLRLLKMLLQRPVFVPKLLQFRTCHWSRIQVLQLRYVLTHSPPRDSSFPRYWKTSKKYMEQFKSNSILFQHRSRPLVQEQPYKVIL